MVLQKNGGNWLCFYFYKVIFDSPIVQFMCCHLPKFDLGYLIPQIGPTTYTTHMNYSIQYGTANNCENWLCFYFLKQLLTCHFYNSCATVSHTLIWDISSHILFLDQPLTPSTCITVFNMVLQKTGRIMIFNSPILQFTCCPLQNLWSEISHSTEFFCPATYTTILCCSIQQGAKKTVRIGLDSTFSFFTVMFHSLFFQFTWCHLPILWFWWSHPTEIFCPATDTTPKLSCIFAPQNQNREPMCLFII